jgi:DNA-binding PadR family transcriptional regulator
MLDCGFLQAREDRTYAVSDRGREELGQVEPQYSILTVFARGLKT